MSRYKDMTNPELVAEIGRLSGEEREKALASLPGGRRAAVEDVFAKSPQTDGARQAVLDRLGREKQINDSQAWTADGISPNGPLVTQATAGKYTEHADPEGALNTLVEQTAAKMSADPVASVLGKDTSTTLSSDEAAKGKVDAEAAAESSAATTAPVEDADAGKKLKGRLPDDFPGRKALADADINTYAQLRKRLEAGEHIPGIGDATQAQIDAALKE